VQIFFFITLESTMYSRKRKGWITAFAVEQMSFVSNVTCKKTGHTLELRLRAVAGFNFQMIPCLVR